ncbi:MAG: hypothetical protein HKO05_01495 [Erythrobacter sp.]|nr:hypothetical protein [Erythrobacter sp.]
MQKLIGLLVAVVLVPLVAALGALVLMVLGAAAGWLAGLVFPQVFANLSDMAFGKAVPAWQIGAMLGFVGGFFRSFGNRRSNK